jgi:iodotyrosine deiodinase
LSLGLYKSRIPDCESRIEPNPDIFMTKSKFIPLTAYREYPIDDMVQRAQDFNAQMQRRRTVRHFSDRPVPRDVIELCLRAAGSAPSGANLQPWHFVAVSNDEVKRRIREAAEEQEREFYSRRASQEWLDALALLGTDEDKSLLEMAPYLIAVFVQRHKRLPDGRTLKNYYPVESVGIATGILLTAIHHVGLVALTYTPSRMRFLNRILGRPSSERPFLILVVGYPAEDAMVPELRRKAFDEIVTFV